MSKIQVFDYSAKNFPLDSHQSCSICLLELLSDKCTIWVSKAQFLSHLGPQSKSKFLSLITFSKRFHWFHFSMASHAHCKYFKMCGEYGPQRLFGPRNFGIFSGLWSFSQNCFTGFVSVFGNRPIGAIFRGMLNIGLRGMADRALLAWYPRHLPAPIIVCAQSSREITTQYIRTNQPQCRIYTLLKRVSVHISLPCLTKHYT